MEKKDSVRKIKKVQKPSSSSSSSSSDSSDCSSSSSSSESDDHRHRKTKSGVVKKRKVVSGTAKKVVSKKVYAERKLKKNPEKKHVLERGEASSASRLQIKQRKTNKKDPRHQAIVEKEVVHDTYRAPKREKAHRVTERSHSPRISSHTRSPIVPKRSQYSSREYEHKSPDRRSPVPQKYHSPSLMSNSRRRESSKERDRREREIARQKERDQALARSQERQRERERLKRLERERSLDGGLDKPRIRIGRLLPTEKERARALALAVGHSRSPERYASRSRSRGRRSRSLKYDSDHDREYYRRSRSGSHGHTHTHKQHAALRERDYERERRREKSPYSRGERRGSFEEEHRGYSGRHEVVTSRTSLERPSTKDWDRHPEIPSSSSSRKWEEPHQSSPGHYNPSESEQWISKSYYYSESKVSASVVREEGLPPTISHGPSRRWASSNSGGQSDWHHKKDQQFEYSSPRPHLRMKSSGSYRGTPPGFHGGSRMPFASHRGASSGGSDFFQRSRYSIDRRGQNSSQLISKIKDGPPLLPPRGQLESIVNAEDEIKKEISEDGPSETVAEEDMETGSTSGKTESIAPVVGPTSQPQSQPSEEVIEDNLSEISDEADEILNREEELQKTSVNTELLGESNCEDDLKSCSEQTGFSQLDKNTGNIQKANKELKEEMDLDFEEISDGELEEEKFKGFGDALGVDWASLSRESCRPTPKDDTSVANAIACKWRGYNVLLDLGVSVHFAGQEFAEQILQKAYEQKLLETKTVKKEEPDTVSETLDKIKQEPGIQSDAADENKFKIVHPVANIQVGIRERQEEEKNLIANSAGPFSRAMSARRDLKLRRHLCGLPERELGNFMATSTKPPKINDELKLLAFALFKKGRERNNNVVAEIAVE